MNVSMWYHLFHLLVDFYSSFALLLKDSKILFFFFEFAVLEFAGKVRFVVFLNF